MNKLTKKLLKKNNSREKEIFKENREIYTNMVVYLRGSDLTNYNQEVVREDIIELIIDGQQRGDDIKKVMGGRYKEICDEIIEVMPRKTKKDKMMEFVDLSLSALWILGVIVLAKTLIINLISEKAQFDFTLTVGNIINALLTIIIANVIILFVTKRALDTKNDKKIVSFLKTWFITAVISGVIILNIIYFKTIVVSISLWLAAIIVLFIFIIERIVSQKT